MLYCKLELTRFGGSSDLCVKRFCSYLLVLCGETASRVSHAAGASREGIFSCHRRVEPLFTITQSSEEPPNRLFREVDDHLLQVVMSSVSLPYVSRCFTNSTEEPQTGVTSPYGEALHRELV